MSLYDKIHFKMISFMHDTLYGLFVDADKMLNDSGLDKGQTVLEVGCGPGHFTIPAANIVGNNGKIIAIDLNPFAIKKVQEKLSKQDITNVELKKIDAQETNLEDNSIDLIFVFGVLHYLDLDKALPEFHRLLKQKGTLIVQKSRKAKKVLLEAAKRGNLFKKKDQKTRVIIFEKN